MIAAPRARTIPVRALAIPGSAADVLAVGALALFVAVVAWDAVGGGVRIGIDSAVFFYPMFELLGDRLRGGDWLPGWNPHQFAGAPLAADPQSGWGYLPAMLLFAGLPLDAAAPAFLVGHLLLAGFGTYALARVLGMPPLGALTAGMAFVGSGFVRDRAVCCFAHVMVAAWIPPLLLATELAIRARRRPARIGWWALAGFSVSQILAGWLGQGAYYALLLLGLYLFARTVLKAGTGVGSGPWWDGLARRVAALAMHGGVVLAVGFGLAATSLLPRLEYNERSSLAGGYAGAEAAVGGFGRLEEATDRLLWPSGWYAGGAALALALVAVPLAGRRYRVPVLAVATAAALPLCFRQTTLLHATLYAVLPRFERLHRHYPERALLVVYLGVALLAGAAVAALATRRVPRATGVVVGLLPVVALGGVLALGADAPEWTRLMVVVVGLFVVGHALLPGAAWRLAAPVALCLTVAVDGLATGSDAVEKFPRVDLGAYYEPGGSGAFLQGRGDGEDGERWRFFGYAPEIALSGQWPPAAYRYRFPDPAVAALVVNDRATALGLEDVQGYNPVQLRRFADLMLAANGAGQEYREANVLPAGVDSPLLDLLGARYVVVPATQPVPPELADLRSVYADGQVRVLERPGALPRAWLVHEARAVGEGEALGLLADGAVDPRRVALVEGPIPELAPPTDPAADRAVVTVGGADTLVVETRSDAAAMLVLGEVAYPAWEATVDGAAAEVLTVDHLLRAVAVPAGERTVELRYESRTLRLGTAISLATLLGVGAAGIGAWAWERRGAHAGIGAGPGLKARAQPTKPLRG